MRFFELIRAFLNDWKAASKLEGCDSKLVEYCNLVENWSNCVSPYSLPRK